MDDFSNIPRWLNWDPIYFVNKNNKKVYKIEGRGGSCVPAVLGSNLGTTEAVKIHQGPHRAEPRHHPR